MRILLDECLPRELADELSGHDVRTVQQEGWAGLENGELLQRAAATFEVLLTIDKLRLVMRREKGAPAPLSHTLSPLQTSKNPAPQIYLSLVEKWSKDWGAPPSALSGDL